MKPTCMFQKQSIKNVKQVGKNMNNTYLQTSSHEHEIFHQYLRNEPALWVQPLWFYRSRLQCQAPVSVPRRPVNIEEIMRRESA
jgi:hypothetical protein